MESIQQSSGTGELDMNAAQRKPFRVFISYRRSDAGGYAGWLNYSLEPHLGEGNIFRDIVALEAGIDFMEAIDIAIRQSDVVLCLIGATWVSVASSNGTRRLEADQDPVRVEVETALNRRKTIIPVLLEGASMPSEAELPEEIRSLARLNAHSMSDARWKQDLGKLLERLDNLRNQSQSGRLSGSEIYERCKNNDAPPDWVGRSGGAFGKLFRDDLSSGGWKDQSYEVQFGGTCASKNWFGAADFVAAIEAEKESPIHAGLDRKTTD